MELQANAQKQTTPTPNSPDIQRDEQVAQAPGITTMPKTTGPKRSRVRLIILLVVLGVLVGGGYFWWQAGFTPDISRFFAAEVVPKYEWVLIPSNTYPGLTGKNNNCSNNGIVQDSWSCSRLSEGMVVRMYGVQQVGDKLGQGWSESFNVDKSVVTYSRWQNCTQAGGADAGPGARVYECKNVGDAEPAPTPPPDYRWVKVGGVPAFRPHMRGPYSSVNLKTYWPCDANITTVVTCDASNVGKEAVAEYKATAFVVAADRGTYFQAHAGTLQADPSKLSLTGFDETTCGGSPSFLQRIGAGFRSWEAWQCQSAAAVVQPAPTADLKCHDANGNPIDGPCTIASGTNATFTWSSTNATSCSGSSTPLTSGGAPETYPNLSTQGTNQEGPIEQEATFTLTCTGPGGSATDTVIVRIQPGQLGSLTCSPASATVPSGQSVTFTASGSAAASDVAWSATDGDPATGLGFTFETTFSHTGPAEVRTFSVSMQRGPSIGSCDVSVQCSPPSCAAPPVGCSYENASVCECGTLVCATQTPTPEELSCAPASQTVNTGSTATLQASGGSGIYSWSSPGGTVQSSSLANEHRVAYSQPGGYTVTVNDGQGFAQCTVSVTTVAISPTPTPTPEPGESALSVNKRVRNITRGSAEANSVEASHGDTVEFVVHITSVGDITALGVDVRDPMPPAFVFIPGSVTVNGVVNSGDPRNKIFIGEIAPGNTTIVRFRATIEHPAGNANLNTLNRATVSILGIEERSDTSMVVFDSPAPSVIPPAAEVPTGPGQATVMALIVSAIATLLYVGYTSTGAFQRREAFDIARENRRHPTFHD